jgi:hypothetical protein
MPGTQPKSRLNKVMEIFLWLVALGVLAENVFLFLQNRHLSEALAPQITAGTQLRMLAGLGFDGRLEPVALPAAGSKLLIITFSPGCPACQANQDGWMRLASTLEQRGVRVLWVAVIPSKSRETTVRNTAYALPIPWPIRPTEPTSNLASRGSPILCWWEPRVEWKRCGRDAWIREAGTRCLPILANGWRRLLRSKAKLSPTQPAAGRGCPKLPPKAVSKT